MDPETIFSAALEKATSEERDAFLQEACGDDAALRAEIDALLAAHNDAGSFLERTPEELEATASHPGSADALEAVDENAWRKLLESTDDADSLGRISGYEVKELVGRGGMGVVLRATDPKLNRVVAIKLLAPEFATSVMAVRRFLREAQAAAAVAHDHVVTIHAIDEQAQPPIIVMEYVPGKSLQQKIDAEGALDLRSILRIGMQAASGLAAAHRQGLVHRDIKPANILLENGIERVKLTDFGLARAVDDIGMTRNGQITGTPQYMSPEQAQGQRVDHRTDLFSLGCVLYAMCTGQAAFRADSAVAVMHRIVHDTPRPIHDINEDVPAWLCDIVDRLLAKEADDRFHSAEEVADLLGRHLAHLQQPDAVPMPEPIGAANSPAETENGPLSPEGNQELPGWFFLKIRPWMVLTVIGIAVGVRLLAEFGSAEAAVLAGMIVWILAVPLLLFLVAWKLLRRNAEVGAGGKPRRQSQTSFWFILFAMGPLIAIGIVKQFLPDGGFAQTVFVGLVAAGIAGWLMYQRSRLDPSYVEQQKDQTPATKRRRWVASLLLLAAVGWLFITQHFPLSQRPSLSPRTEKGVESAPREVALSDRANQPFIRLDHTLHETSHFRDKARVIAIDLSRDGKKSVAACLGGPSGGHVGVWKNLNHRERTADAPGVRDAAISPDGTRLAWVGDGERVHIEKTAFQISGPDWKVNPPSILETVTWSPDGKGLLASTNTAVFVWQNENIDAPAFGVEAGGDATIGASAWKPDGHSIACGTSAGELILLTIAGPSDIAEHRFNVEPIGTGISALRWSNDRKILLLARSDGAVQLIELTSSGLPAGSSASAEQEAETIVPVTIVGAGNGGSAGAIDISPDSSLIAVAENSTDEPRIRLIANRTNGQPLRDDVEDLVLTRADGGHALPVTDLAFSSDGRYLISAGEDGAIKRWQFNTRLSASGE